MSKLKIISTLSGVIGSVVTGLIGGWTTGLQTLCIFILIDLLTGFIAAALNKSEKSVNGGISSKVIWVGIAKKVMEILFVVVGHQLDILVGANYIRDAVIIAYIITETVSIIENAGLMGLYVPPVIKKAIDILKDKSE